MHKVINKLNRVRSNCDGRGRGICFPVTQDNIRFRGVEFKPNFLIFRLKDSKSFSDTLKSSTKVKDVICIAYQGKVYRGQNNFCNQEVHWSGLSDLSKIWQKEKTNFLVLSFWNLSYWGMPPFLSSGQGLIQDFCWRDKKLKKTHQTFVYMHFC